MTSGSSFHLQYVQRLQNSRGGTPHRDPATSMVSAAGLSCCPLCPSDRNIQKLLQKNITGPESLTIWGNLGGVDQEVAPPELHLQKSAL